MQGMVGNNLWEEEACGVGQKVGVVTHYSGTSALIGWRDGLIRRRKKRRCGVGEEEEEEEEGGEEEAEDDKRKKTGEKELLPDSCRKRRVTAETADVEKDLRWEERCAYVSE